MRSCPFVEVRDHGFAERVDAYSDVKKSFDGARIDGHWTASRNEKVLTRDLVGGVGALLLHLETTAYHQLNAVGSQIWHLLETPLSLATLVEKLRVLVPKAPENLNDDVRDYLVNLADRDLIRLDPPS